MDQREKLLIGIEHILDVASDLTQEMDRLERVEEECKFLKEQLFLAQFNRAERQVFELAVDGHSATEMAKILFKSRETIRGQRRSIIRKLQVSSIEEAVRKYKEVQKKETFELIKSTHFNLAF
ncbi:response regulator transcription factor [Priestia endophytica]|uniref:response regulator transcription factor n=1 Tax=Priestia endophytica TaxID=135735 RepID=UPI00124CEC54|nr:helix-turn-helix transcriptional regulator [Priestia endophytica]KAB2486519.1 helix-turn-helix transcriptional regulator [Priestia endophytica]